MTEPSASPSTGFKLEALFSPIQRCEAVDPATLDPAGPADEGKMMVGWDWGWAEPTRLFEVAVSLDREPTRGRPERIGIKVVARFSITGEPTSVQTEEFALRNATAMLVPYLRASLSQLTANGPFGMQLLQPINVAAAIERFDPRLATAARQGMLTK